MVDIGPQPADHIEALELAIEALEDAIARSRRLMTIGRAATVIGPVLLVALIFGVFDATPARVLAAFALIIGGLVLAGSSKSSTAEFQRRRARAVAERNAAIDALGLVPAGEEGG